MKGNRLSVLVWLLLVLLILSGCGQDVTNQTIDLPEPTNYDNTLMTIVSNGVTTYPYERFTFSKVKKKDTWIAADAVP